MASSILEQHWELKQHIMPYLKPRSDARWGMLCASVLFPTPLGLCELETGFLLCQLNRKNQHYLSNPPPPAHTHQMYFLHSQPLSQFTVEKGDNRRKEVQDFSQHSTSPKGYVVASQIRLMVRIQANRWSFLFSPYFNLILFPLFPALMFKPEQKKEWDCISLKQYCEVELHL